MRNLIKQNAESFLSRYPKVFFCHIPKCAGVSLSNAIHASLYPSIFKATRISSHIDLKASKISAQLLDIDMIMAREVQLAFHLSDKYKRFTTGHCRARPEIVDNFSDTWNFVTILRDPNKRFVSEFVYNKYKESDWMRHSDEIEDYLSSAAALHSATTYARYFSKYNNAEEIFANEDEAITSAISNLKSFAVSGTLEKLDEWQNKFNSHFQTRIKIDSKNSSPNKTESSNLYENKDIMSKIQNISRIDYAIYSSLVNA